MLCALLQLLHTLQNAGGSHVQRTACQRKQAIQHTGVIVAVSNRQTALDLFASDVAVPCELMCVLWPWLIRTLVHIDRESQTVWHNLE